MAGFTAFSERFGEEAAYSLMQRVSELMTDAIHQQSGTVKSFTGDGVMATFGVPVALEDAPMRACRAALDIQQRIAWAAADIERTHGVRPQMRIGINTGPMVVGEVQSGEGTSVTVIGDTVNVASRLQSLAEPGGVLLSESTYHQVQGLVEARPAGEHEIKGKAKRQKVYHLQSIRPGAVRFDRALSRGLTTYVGRTRELEMLERSLDAAANSTRVIDLVGEPGIGKSRLIHEFRGRVAEKQIFVLSGNCTPDGQQTPFLPFIDIVRSSFRLTESEAESEIARKLEKGLSVLGLATDQNLGLLLNLLGLKPPEGALKGLDGVLIGLRTRDLLLRLLQERCHIMPVVMAVEDLHWMDRVSEELFDRLLSTEHELPLLIVYTRRPEYRPPWRERRNVTEIRLEPLSAADTSQIIRARLGVADLPESLARLVTDKAEGNPLFAEEIASYLIERGVVRSNAGGVEYDAGAVSAVLPASVQALLTSRVDRLPPSERALLQAAAVIGRRFDPDVLAATTGAEGDVYARLAAMQAADLIYRDSKSGDFIFKHALVRDALYDSLLSGSRTALHLKVADEIERRGNNRLVEVAEMLAYHYGQTQRADKAFTYLVMAGQKSLGVYSLDEADHYFERALELFEARAGSPGPHALAELLTYMSQLLNLKFHPGKLKRLVDRYSLHIDSFGDLPQSVIILSNYAFATMMMCQFRTAERAAVRALEIALRLGDDRCKAYARGAVILTDAILGSLSLEEAEQHGRLAARESEHIDDPHLHNWIGFATAWDYLNRSLTDRGRASIEELYARGQRTGDPRAVGMGLWLLGWLDIVDERYADALLHGEEYIRVALSPMDKEIGVWAKCIGQIFLGQVREGASLLTEYRQRALANEWVYALAGIDAPLGAAKVLQGDLSGGVRFIEAAIERNYKAENSNGADFARMILAEIYIEILGNKQRPPVRVILSNLPFLILTALNGWKKAVSLLKAARTNPMFGGITHAGSRIEADLGILYLMKKRTDEARDCLHRARPIAEQLKAMALLAKIDSALACL